MSNVQRRLWRERRWPWRGATGRSITTLHTAQAGQKGETAGMTTTGSIEGRTTRLPSRAGGARFTGASASLKVVSGESARGTTETQTAATNRKRTDIQRSRFTAHITPKCLQTTPAILACQSCFRATEAAFGAAESSAGHLSAPVLMRLRLSLSSFVSARFLSSCM